MPISRDILWLNTSPSLERFDRPLIDYLSKQVPIARWKYIQTQDEPSSLTRALELLHDYLKSRCQSVHIIGHGTSGLLGLLYARKYPTRIKSLTLLSVGVNPGIDWHAHYYAMCQLLPISRQKILAQMVRIMFGSRDDYSTKRLVRVLEKDLNHSPSPHSLFRRVKEPSGGVSVPLMVCGSKDDGIVDRHSLRGWRDWFKEGDRLWECPQGRHFFQSFYPQLTGKEILNFWQSLSLEMIEV